MSNCISDHPRRATFSLARARRQHEQYVNTLYGLGLEIIRLPPDPDHPDSCFVEDTAVIHNGRAIICRPEPIMRRGEVEAVEDILSQYMPVRRVDAPDTLEGGDVIHLSNRLIVGVSRRSTTGGVEQMRKWLRVPVDIIEDPEMFHLKSHVTAIDDSTIVGTRPKVDNEVFGDVVRIVVPEREAYAANTLTVNGVVLVSAGHDTTARLIREAGYDTIELEMYEFEKCQGALTCLSLLF